jgi:hypothetical protein
MRFVTRSRISPLTSIALTLCAALSVGAQAAEGSRIQFVTGAVKVIRADGTEVPAAKGDIIGPGDRLVTGADGMAQVRALDQGVLALRANSECRFEQRGSGLDVALTRGQLRTVTDLGGATKGMINVTTPDSRLAVGDGDVETGVKPADAGGKGGESFSQVHTGVIKLDGARGGALTLQPGQLAKVGDAIAPTVITEKPVFIQPVLPLPTVVGGKPANATLGTLATSVDPKAELPLLTTPTPGFQPGVLTALGDNIGTKGLNTEPPQVKLPEVRLEYANATVVGGSAAVNSGLAGQTFLVGGRLGSTDKTITPTATTIDSSKITGTVAFQPTTATLTNGQTISAIQPIGGSKLVTPAGIAEKLVLLPSTTPTTNTVLSNSTLNTLNTSNTINPKVTQTTTPKINIGILPKLNLP